MNKNTDRFTAEHVDAQIEERLYTGERPSAGSRLLQDMQRYARSEQEQDAQLLQRAWKRIDAQRTGVANTRQSTLQPTDIGRIRHMKHQEKQLYPERSLAPRFGFSVAVLVSILVVGSMLAVFSLAKSAHQNSSTASPKTISQENQTHQQETFQLGKTPTGIYTGTSRLDPTNGKVIWNFLLRFDGRNAIANQTMVQDGLSFVVSQDDIVYAVNATNGKLVWQDQLPVSLYKNVQEINGTLYLLNQNGNLLALNAANGKVLRTSQESFNDFSIANGVLYGSQGATLTAIQLSNNKQLWQAKGVEGQTFDLPHYVDGKVYLTSTGNESPSGSIYGFDASNGKALWPAQRFSGILLGLTVAQGKLYFGVFGSAIYAYDAATGQQSWRTALAYHNLGTPALAGPVVEGNLIYALFNPTTTLNTGSKESSPSGIATVDATTGAIKSTYSPTAHTSQIDTFTVHDGTLYISQLLNSPKIVAVRANGQTLWSVDGNSSNDIAAIF
ncbi:MAG TPA: PQQ-binding-like beta-propeller repeat protein [Ktedonobacteraceae bacterium]|nr:PQQ-binding-like beta-propeller repeat protein [Ktedonobacteraceae bacterium]